MRRLWPIQDVVQSLEALDRDRRLHPDDGGAIWRPGRTADPHDRRDLSESAPYGFEPGGKKGAWAAHRTHQRRHKHQASCRNRCERTPHQPAHGGRPGQRLHRRRSPAGQPPQGPMAARRSGGYAADWFRDALEARGHHACIPGRKSRTESIRYDKRRYRSRNRIERKAAQPDHVRPGSRTGVASPSATIDTRLSSCPPTTSPPHCSSGYKS